MEPWVMSAMQDSQSPSQAQVASEPGAVAVQQHQDLELAQAVLLRDRKATAEFVHRFSGAIYRYLQSRLAPRTQHVEDVAQEVFVAAWQQLRNYRGTSSLEAWMFGITRHKIEDHYRDRLQRAEAWDDMEVEVIDGTLPALDIELDRERTAARAMLVLQQLPEHYSTILLWRYWEKRSAREIAASTGRTEKAVERLLARAREQFKRRWLDA